MMASLKGLHGHRKLFVSPVRSCRQTFVVNAMDHAGDEFNRRDSPEWGSVHQAVFAHAIFNNTMLDCITNRFAQRSFPNAVSAHEVDVVWRLGLQENWARW
jgi:hypothetical protein